MFNRFTYQRNFLEHNYTIFIVDDNFDYSTTSEMIAFDNILEIIIKCYEEKELDVAANLLKALLFIKEVYGYNYFMDGVEKSWQKILLEWVPSSKPYINKLEKYLVFI